MKKRIDRWLTKALIDRYRKIFRENQGMAERLVEENNKILVRLELLYLEQKKG